MIVATSQRSKGTGTRVNKLTSNLDALDAAEPYDACIIGSGMAGSVLGTRLAHKGLRVLMLESGNSLLNWLSDARLKRLAEYEFTGDTNYPLTRTTGRLVGGNSNFWTGRAERFQPSDFVPHPYTPADNPWPIRFWELEPYYERAEQTLRVRGGELSKYMPPRRAPLPHPPRPDITDLKQLLARCGVVVDDSPTATPARSVRFFKMHREVLPEFVKAPSGTLVSGVTVTRLPTDTTGRVTGATCRTFDGVERTARARVFINACGGIQSPRLLLLSKSQRFQHGIGNDHDRVGRGFNEHAGVNIYAKIPHNRHTLYPRHKIGRTHQFYERFRPEGLGSIHPVFIQSYLFPHHLIAYKLADVPRHIGKILSRAVKATIYIGCQIEMKPVDDNRVTLSSSRTDPFGDPIAHLIFNYTDEDRRLIEKVRALLHGWFDTLGAVDRDEIDVTWARHHAGTCRMGDDPATSVCDANLRVHDCPNLYLAGSEVFPTGTGLPPALTIVAFAHRLGDHLVERLASPDAGFAAARRVAARSAAEHAVAQT
jgi:choline dehydrogenase-like flavoprotein